MEQICIHLCNRRITWTDLSQPSGSPRIWLAGRARDLRLGPQACHIARSFPYRTRFVTTRRDFLCRSAITAAGFTLPAGALSQTVRPGTASGAPEPGAAFLDVRRPPDSVTAQTARGDQQLRSVGGRWLGSGLSVSFREVPGALRAELSAPGAAVARLHLRWRGVLSAMRRIMGDAWERGYGDLEWRGFVPNRVMPWYAAAWDGQATHGYGVRTGANAFCFWQLDQGGISLWADVRSGGVPLQLRGRPLVVCDITCRPGRPEESPFDAIHAFCGELCLHPRLPTQPVYGSNDWYWAYGNNSAASVRDDARRIVELSPSGNNRPFVVIDDGWQPERGADKAGVGTWDRGNEKFPDMPGLAREVRRIGGRPGIWIRPLLAPDGIPDAWRLARDRTVLDPTVPEVRQKIADDLRRLTRWGYELIKHDYSTWDVLGRWGFRMGASITDDGWTFRSGPGRTTAEVLNDLYGAIREAAGGSLVLGCNTVSHLSAGRFEMCRIGDDTSGTEWDRVRRMGVNSLAFRGAQHGAFYAADPDCAGVTTRIPWQLNRQWLDLLARSGTMLFVSLAPDALGIQQRRDLRSALAQAALPRPLGEPVDWLDDTWPTRWRFQGRMQQYDWVGPDGVTEVGGRDT